MPRALFVAAPSRLRRFESAFSSITRARGLDYAARGRVRIAKATHDWLQARVQGQERYDVELQGVAAVLRVRCSCPYFASGEACKHVWATLLVADAEGSLERAGELRSLELDPAAFDADGSDEDESFDGEHGEEEDPPFDAGEENARAPPSFAITAPRRSPVRSAGWREVLAFAEASDTPPPPSKPLHYVIDPLATKATGALVVRVMEQTGRRDASLWRPAQVARPLANHTTVPDALMLGMLDAWAPNSGWHHFGRGSLAPATFSVPTAASAELVERMASSGRAHLGGASSPPLRWESEPFVLALEAVACNGRPGLIVRAWLERGDERVAAAEPELVVAGGLVFWADRVAPLDDCGQFPWIAGERNLGPAQVPAADVDDLVEALIRPARAPRLRLPAEHALSEIRVPGRPYALLRTSRDSLQGGHAAEAGLDYDGERVPLETPGTAVLDRARRRLIVRDQPAEDLARAQLEAAGVRALPAWRRTKAGKPEHRVALSRLEPAARALVAQGWRVEVDGRLRRAAGAFGITVVTGIDWLDVRIEARFEGVDAPLPELLNALRQKRRSVVLADGSVGELSDEQVDKLRRWAAMAESRADSLRFRKVQVALVAALAEGEPPSAFDDAFLKLRAEIDAFAGVDPVDARRTFRGKLRDYQRHGLGWLQALRRLGFGGCVADDMGLGKTVQVLAMLDARRQERPAPGPSLVVAPRSLLFNWAAEAERFVPRLRVLHHDGPTRRAAADHFAEYDLVLTTYGLVRSDLDALSSIDFDYVILDEAQAIKTPRTATARAVRTLRARHRLALTGTPVENHLGELASLLDFLNPGVLGASSALSSLAQGAHRVDDATRAVLARAVRPFFLRRTKRQVARELPDRVEQTLACDLEGEQRRLYDELHAHYRRSLAKRVARDGVGRSTAHILEALLRLRQAACHPGLIDDRRRGEPSAKLDILLEQLDGVLAQGQKALVFSQFTSLLSIVRDRLGERGVVHEYLDGATRDRAERVARFQSDERCSVFLLSLKAGGTGLNLTAAEYVFLLDPWWNPAVEAQAIDRAHRIGQTRTVFGYRLLARGTVEEKVALLQEQKRELADALFGEGGAAVGGLTREDLELLLGQ